MAAPSLREKFKLLRQWQIQQQKEFERMKMENATTFSNSPSSRDVAEYDSDKENFDNDVNTRHEGKKGNTSNEQLLQRMSANSLESALKLAASELKLQNGSISESAADKTDENSDCENEETRYFESDSWNGEMKLETAIFKEIVDSKIHYQAGVLSDEESETEAINELDGFYPIIYSEDNASQGELERNDKIGDGYDENDGDNGYYNKVHDDDDNDDDDNDDDDEEDGDDDDGYGHAGDDDDVDDSSNNPTDKMTKAVVPYDEKPVQSKIGTNVISFDELVEKQLEADRRTENKDDSTDKNVVLRRKEFLRKGEGIARFISGIKPGKNINRPASKSSNPVSLPKATLKLNPVAKRKSERDEKMAAPGIRQDQSEERLMRKDDEKIEQSNPVSNRKVMANAHPQPRSLCSPARKPVCSSIEASFQKMMESKNVEDMVAEEELAEFELLEKVALDTSISSNVSSVLRLVSGRKPNLSHHNTSSPINKAAFYKRELDLNAAGSEIEEESDVDRVPSADESDNEIDSVANDDKTMDADERDEIGNEGREGLNYNNFQFLDHSTWNDTIQSSDAIDDGDLTITESPKAKVPTMENHSKSVESSPPTSKLMKKFFPKLGLKEQMVKPNHQVTKMTKKGQESSGFVGEKANSSSSSSNAEKENIAPSTYSDVLKSKLSELEAEISRFKSENSVLEKLRFEKEKELNSLKSEVQQFQKQRAEELERIETFREEEMQKLRREKKTFEKYQKAARSAPNKKERDEIEVLKKQVSELDEEMKRRDSKWSGSAARFRKRIEDLENENFELKESMKLLEQERLKRWASREQQGTGKEEKHLHQSSTADEIQDQHNYWKQGSQPTAFESNAVAKKASANSRKSVSPRPEPEKAKTVGRATDVVPRTDVIPYEQPETPRKPDVGNQEVSCDRESSEQASKRLSLTPERQRVENIGNDDGTLRHQDGKVERILPDGAREITFPNGTRKTIDAANQHIVVSFFNGDMKQILADGRTVYYYAESKTTHTTYKDGTEVFEFSNGQSEKHYPDGRKVITFHDQTVKCIFSNGAEETVFADGTIQNVDNKGQRTISFPNGQREIHSQNFKRREYPDGTVKTVYQDGRQETRYSTGRIRIKDRSGNVLLDTGLS